MTLPDKWSCYRCHQLFHVLNVTVSNSRPPTPPPGPLLQPHRPARHSLREPFRPPAQALGWGIPPLLPQSQTNQPTNPQMNNNIFIWKKRIRARVHHVGLEAVAPLEPGASKLVPALRCRTGTPILCSLGPCRLVPCWLQPQAVLLTVERQDPQVLSPVAPP